MTSHAPEQPPIPAPATPILRRIWGITLRHAYLYLQSWPRLLEMIFWPIQNIALYGFISLSMVQRFGHTDVMTDAYLGGLLLGEIFSRSVMAMLVMHMEEVWSRNLGHLFASPLRLRDYALSLMGLSLIRCLVAVTPAFIIAAWLFDFSILRLGWALPIYALLLCMSGWWYGLLIAALLMRFGQAAEWLGWMATWALMPFMAAYYPVSILPHGAQIVSWTLPGTYVFQSMKQQFATGQINVTDLMISLALNLVYLILSAFVLSRAFTATKKLGGLLQMGE